MDDLKNRFLTASAYTDSSGYLCMILICFLTAIFTLCASQAIALDIRPLQGEDWKNFRQMRLTALQENPNAYGIAYADEACRTNEEWQIICQDAEEGKKKWYVVAEYEGSLIGMLGAVELFGTYMRHQVEIVQAYVMPKFRRCGVMTQLFLALKTELQKVDHLEQMIAWVTLHELQLSKEMLEKAGFTLAGTLSKTIKFEDQYYDCCWLEAPLKKDH